ncbi:MAG: CBS domain-containing protein [Nitrospira sp.]
MDFQTYDAYRAGEEADAVCRDGRMNPVRSQSRARGRVRIHLPWGLDRFESWFSGLWLAFIGWFLMNAAQESVVQVSIRSALSGLTAEDVMSRDCPSVSGRMSLAELIQNHVLRTGQRCFTVMDGDRLEGLVTLHHMKATPQERWAQISVEEAMTPVSRVRVVAPDQPLLEVLRLLDSQDVNQVPVAKNGSLLGMITRERLLRVLSTHVELGECGASFSPASA